MNNTETEMTLDEWCKSLPDFHLVNKELSELRDHITALEAEKAELVKYVAHKNSCTLAIGECDCGLDKLLKQEQEL